MSNKWFVPADFSDIEEEIAQENVEVKPPKEEFTFPNKTQLVELKSKLEHQFKKCHHGTSSLSSMAIQASTAQPTSSFMHILFEDFNPKNLKTFVNLLRQDYGHRVAKWAVNDLFAPYYPGIVDFFDKEVKGGN